MIILRLEYRKWTGIYFLSDRMVCVERVEQCLCDGLGAELVKVKSGAGERLSDMPVSEGPR